jgi:SEL1 protein
MLISIRSCGWNGIGKPSSNDINLVSCPFSINFELNPNVRRDTRQLDQPVVKYIESHSDDVTELQFHPTQPQIILSGSTDGLVNIYNTTITDEEEALHQTINHGHSIHHANFLNDVDIFALSHDEKFSMYELVTNSEEGVEEPPPVHYGDMREMLGGEYIANVLRRQDGGAVIGVGTHR